jgi:hypothetical protein
MGGGKICRSDAGGRTAEPLTDQTGDKICRHVDSQHPRCLPGLRPLSHEAQRGCVRSPDLCGDAGARTAGHPTPGHGGFLLHLALLRSRQ